MNRNAPRKPPPEKASEKAHKSYHHGDLKTALVEAAEVIIAAEGMEGFTLRKATRKAGVSPGAPNHHFGGMTGLLTEVARRAYEDLGKALAEITLTGEASRDMRMLATAYVNFARNNPGRFRLMGRMDLIETDDPALLASAQAALRIIGDIAVQMIGGIVPTLGVGPRDARFMALIAPIHGLAHIVVERRWIKLSQTDDPERYFLERILPDILTTLWPDR